MEGLDRALWFAGDLGDPWVFEIAEALPRSTLRFDCPDDLPETWPIDRPQPFALVLHRSKLTPIDAQRVARLKSRADRTPRVVLCVGPHARYVDVERWSRLADAVIPEATARETIVRQALLTERRPRAIAGPRPKIAIVSTNYELRAMLVDASKSAGYLVEAVVEPDDSSTNLVTAWDVPVLEPGWTERLERLARSRPVVALLGFADRENVTLARRAGAGACLDLPCDLVDFVGVLDKLTAIRHDQAHELPPTPSAKRSSAIRKTGPY